MSFDINADGWVVRYNDEEVRLRTISYWDREPIYNDIDYLYTKHTLCARGTVNLGLYEGKADACVLDQGRANLQGLLESWNMPRKTLQIEMESDGQVIWRISNILSDSRYGPFPKHYRILKVIGHKTFLVEFTLEFYTNEATPRPSDDDPFRVALLSNRWSMTTALNGAFAQVRTVKGRAVFDSAVLENRGKRADDYRAYLLMPCPPGWRRSGPTFNVSAAGVEVDYLYEDTQQAVDIFPPYVAQVGIHHAFGQVTVSTETKLGLALDVVGSMVGAADGTMDAFSRQAKNPLAVPASLLTGTWSVGRSIANAVLGALPTCESTINIEVRGTPLATMAQLQEVAYGLLVFRMGCIPGIGPRKSLFDTGGKPNPSTFLAWSGDWVNRVVSLQYVMKCGPIVTAWMGKFEDSIFYKPMNFDYTPEGKEKIEMLSDATHTHPKVPPGSASRGEGARPQIKLAPPNEPGTTPFDGDVGHQMVKEGEGMEWNPKTNKPLENAASA
jgi:hypothetical protein